ncbi:MAG: non-canonical purine NTP pyrophosphatase [Candidatus Micrarchaeia archaeon]
MHDIKSLEYGYKNLINKYKKIKPDFDKILKQIAKDNHGVAIATELKKKDRTIEKALTEYGGNINKVTDILRGSIIVERSERIKDVINDIKSEFSVIQIKDYINLPSVSGYMSILIKVKFRGLPAEIQIHLKRLFEMNEYIGHMLYEIERRINAQTKKEKRGQYSWESYVKSEILKVKKYAFLQAWNRQLLIEKNQDPNKLIYIVTSNINKYNEAKRYIPSLIWLNMKIKEIQSMDIDEVVKEKARKVQDFIDAKFIIEDTSLECEGLNGFPGTLISLFMEKMSLEKFAKLVISTGNQKARVITSICFVDGYNNFYIFKGVINGKIVMPKKGLKGWDFDRIFVPDGYDKTFAELGKEKEKISMRKIAFDKLIKFLKAKYSIEV